MSLTAGNVSVILGALVALVTGIVQRDAMVVGTAILTLIGVFVHPPQAPAAKP